MRRVKAVPAARPHGVAGEVSRRFSTSKPGLRFKLLGRYPWRFVMGFFSAGLGVGMDI